MRLTAPAGRGSIAPTLLKSTVLSRDLREGSRPNNHTDSYRAGWVLERSPDCKGGDMLSRRSLIHLDGPESHGHPNTVSPSLKIGSEDRNRIAATSATEFCDSAEGWDEQLCAFHFATDICNMPSPSFSANDAALVLVRRQHTSPLLPKPIQGGVGILPHFFSPSRAIANALSTKPGSTITTPQPRKGNLRQRRQHLLRMPLRLYLRKYLRDFPIRPHQKCSALNAHVLLAIHALLLPHAVCFRDRVIRIRREGVRQSILGRELLLRLRFIRRQPDDHGFFLVEFLREVAKFARLLGASGRVRLGVEEQHHPLAFQFR